MNSAVDSPIAMARSSHGRRVSSLIFGGKKSPKMKNRIQSFVVTKSSRRLLRCIAGDERKEREASRRGISLLELSTVLLLEAANLVHVDGVELALCLLLVGGQLLLVHGLQTDGRVITNADDEHTTALLSALLILLIGEGDVNLGNVIGGVRRRVGVGKHRTAVLVDDEDAGAAVMCCLDGEAAVVGESLAVAVVVRRQTILLGLDGLLLLTTSAAEQEKDGDQNEAEKDKAEEAKHEVDHVVV